MSLRKIFLFALLVGGCGFYAYRIYQWSVFMDELGVCGFANGPCYGEKVKLNLKTQKVDEYIDVPNGKIGFISIKEGADTLAPIVFKLDQNSKLLWALRLETDNCGLPLEEMSNLRLDLERRAIIFFNDTYGEPGDIQLTKDYDFEYMCLSPM